MELARRVALRKQGQDAHAKSIALMRFLSKAAQRLGVASNVYVVGGAVRNFIIDKPIKDIDVVIDAVALGGGKDSDWFAKKLAQAIPASTNVVMNQYGVAILTVKGSWELEGNDLKGEVIEIANARKESYGGEAGKGYKPDMVVPATIEEDVYRREFTFNTLLWRLLDLTNGPEKAEIIDLTGCGLRDLENRELRCPQDPDVVFADDPTRLMRAIKFVAKYGFKIPPDLAASIKKNAPKMKQAPWEAIGNLLVGNVLNEPTAPQALKLMKSLGLLDVVAEMVQEQKPFAAYLAGQLKDRKVALLLDLLDLGLDVRSPVSFLSREQQARLRQVTTPMPEGHAEEFLGHLKKVPLNNMALIEAFDIPKTERGVLSTKARDLMLADPDLAFNPSSLQRAMEAELGRVYKTAAEVELSKGQMETLHEEGEVVVDEVTVKFKQAWGPILAKEEIPGGRAKGKKPSDFDAKELGLGMKVEREHLEGGDYSEEEMKAKTQEIAMDHLTEIPDYYTRLKKMEGEAGIKEARSLVAAAWGETVEEAARVTVKKAKTYVELVMFDFDGTLFRSWEATPSWWGGTELDNGPYSFFVKPESLDVPCVPDKPGSVYWINNAVQAAKKAISNRMVVTVLITGRVGVHKRRVKELLAQKGLNFDHHYFNPGMSAARFKVVVLKNLLVGYNTIDKVTIWENENEKTYDSAMRATAEALGRDVDVEIHHVHVSPKELECGPADFGLPSQNNPAEARLAAAWGGLGHGNHKTAAVTGDGKGVGFFIPIPESLAGQFPSLEPFDDSPPHITFMYVGEITKDRQAAFLLASQEAFAQIEGPVRAVLDGVDIFDQGTKRVSYSKIRFSQDLIQAHDQVRAYLERVGFPVAHSFPFLTPHATLAYMEPHEEWGGVPPEGSWVFDRIQVWGLPKLEEAYFGQPVIVKPEAPELGARKFARLMEKRGNAARLRGGWRRTPQ